MKDMAQDEIKQIEPALDAIEEKLATHLIPSDPDDRKNAYLEIRAGAGGEEAALFAGDLFRMYLQYAQRKGYSVELESESATGIGGYKEIVAKVVGNNVFGRFKYEGGTHRVQRVPDTEASGRIHTSTCTVAIMPEVEDVDVKVEDKDIRIDVFRSSGAGGQHVNKTSSAIRITHLPSGIVVQCQDERSQHKNKDKALKQLQAKLYDAQRSEKDQAYADQRRSMVGSGDRAEKIRTYNYPESRVTDHRIKLTLHKLPAVLNGDLDELIDALHAADQLEKLKTL
jgi:peptide chain release factor 1